MAFVSRPATEKVYLAVGNDEKQCEFFLLWAKNFIPPQKPLVVLHIYRPATTIPHGKNCTVHGWVTSLDLTFIFTGYALYLLNSIAIIFSGTGSSNGCKYVTGRSCSRLSER